MLPTRPVVCKFIFQTICKKTKNTVYRRVDQTLRVAQNQTETQILHKLQNQNLSIHVIKEPYTHCDHMKSQNFNKLSQCLKSFSSIVDTIHQTKSSILAQQIRLQLIKNSNLVALQQRSCKRYTWYNSKHQDPGVETVYLTWKIPEKNTNFQGIIATPKTLIPKKSLKKNQEKYEKNRG